MDRQKNVEQIEALAESYSRIMADARVSHYAVDGILKAVEKLAQEIVADERPSPEA